MVAMKTLKKIVNKAHKLWISGAFNSTDTITTFVSGYSVEFVSTVHDNGEQRIQASVELVEKSWISFDITVV